jgi:hypothetical protein
MVVLLAGALRPHQTVLELTGVVAGRHELRKWIAARLNAENGDFLVDQSTGGMREVDSIASDLRCRDGGRRWNRQCEIRGCDDRRRAIVVDCVELRDRQFGGGWKLSRESFTLRDGDVDVPRLNEELQSDKQNKDKATLYASRG